MSRLVDDLYSLQVESEAARERAKADGDAVLQAYEDGRAIAYRVAITYIRQANSRVEVADVLGRRLP